MLARAITHALVGLEPRRVDVEVHIDNGKQVMAEEPAVKLDYFEIVNRETLDPVSDVSSGALVAVAAYVGNTRLIDNVLVTGKGHAGGPR